jgi:MarR family transcriptional regulator, transcriptional regulator for hemolysin
MEDVMSRIRDIWVYAHNILRSSRLLTTQELASLDLSSAESNIWFHLTTQGDGLHQEEIVEQIDMSKPAVSRAVRSLEEKGYVVRRKDPDDRRASQVLLTAKAHEIGSRIEQVYNDVFAIATQAASEKEIEHFIALFGRVPASYSAAWASKLDHKEG